VTHPYFDLPTPIVIGHRGCAGELPENTIPSFERALSQGAVVLESDVHLACDGVPVLIHDPSVERVTAESACVSETTLAELQSFDAGHWFSSDGGRTYPFRGQGFRIPSLDEAFCALPEARFNLELKSPEPRLVEVCVELVAKHQREAITLLTAGDDEIMGRLRAHLDHQAIPIAQGACTGDVLDFVRTAVAGKAPRSGPMALQIPPTFGDRPLVTRELVEHAHAHRVQVHVWTVNDPAQMSQLLELGVDGIITDYPGRLSRLLSERRGEA
jgi:glycerophosphoryl diester phosphodiesterase